MSTMNAENTTKNIIKLSLKERDTEQQLANLSSRKLWDILTSPAQTLEERKISEAVKKELTKRNAFSNDQKFSKPH